MNINVLRIKEEGYGLWLHKLKLQQKRIHKLYEQFCCNLNFLQLQVWASKYLGKLKGTLALSAPLASGQTLF